MRSSFGAGQQAEPERPAVPSPLINDHVLSQSTPGNTRVATKWRGIGIRIEDDVVVTRDGCEVLSADAPKTIEDIEAIMAPGDTAV